MDDIRKTGVASAIATLAGARNEPVGQALMLLLDYYIAQARDNSDTEEDYGRLRFRQGEISAFKLIMFNMTRGLGPTLK